MRFVFLCSGLNQGEKQKSSLTLTNPTKSRYAFKVNNSSRGLHDLLLCFQVKTTCPKCYVVKPSVVSTPPYSWNRFIEKCSYFRAFWNQNRRLKSLLSRYESCLNAFSECMIFACLQQRNPKPSIVDKFLIEAMTTSEKRTNTADAQMRAANKRDVRLIKVPVFLEGPSTDIDSSKVRHNEKVFFSLFTWFCV